MAMMRRRAAAAVVHAKSKSCCWIRVLLNYISTMADEQRDIGVESATAGVEEVRLDESGQPMSKSALKKLLKKELADKKKAEKAAAMVSVLLLL